MKELSIVITIIAFITLVILYSIGSAGYSHHETTVSKTMGSIVCLSAAIRAYKHEYGVIPKSVAELHSTRNEKHIDFMDDKTNLADAWGKKIKYTVLTNGFEIRSAGPDGNFGTDDDIINNNKDTEPSVGGDGKPAPQP